MIIVTLTASNELLKKRDYRDFFKIEVDGKCVFEVRDGEPEDATLSRDFSACFNIPELMKAAYEAGKAGEEFLIRPVKLKENED